MMHDAGVKWVIRFWQEAYKTMTGLVDFRGLFGELFAKNCRITLEEHEKILKTAISVEFCYEHEAGVYTSHGIQKRISSVSKERAGAIRRQEEEKNKTKKKKSKVKDCPDYSPNNDLIPPGDGQPNLQEEKKKYLDFVYLSESEHAKLLAEWGEKFLSACIAKLDGYLANATKKQHGKKDGYVDMNKVLRGWVYEEISQRMKPAPKGEAAAKKTPLENALDVVEYYKNEIRIAKATGEPEHRISVLEHDLETALERYEELKSKI
jgi:hypothetical protein